MNIFYLDENPYLAAEYHCDKHVVKMILETGQLLSTVQRRFGANSKLLYKRTHENHPCALWLRESAENYAWTYELFLGLSEEYLSRYEREHTTFLKLYNIVSRPPTGLPKVGFTKPALAMPEEYKQNDAVAAYRAYYRGQKRDIATWKYSVIPTWFNEGGG